MKNRVCIIICYFGQLPKTIDTFLYSCKNNSEFSWMIFTDCSVKNPPSNVKIVNTTLEKVKSLAVKKLVMEIVLEAPYKLCDYKVAYGLIFEDYIREYDFWGYGDLDVVYGDLKSFITDELLDNYDKIYPLGHLSLIRNKDICCKLFMQEINNTRSYKRVFTTDTPCFFDEDKGINEKLEASGLKIYTKFDFVDIDGVYKRLRVVDKKTFKLTSPRFNYFYALKKNYKKQIFYWHEGHLYQRYVKSGSLMDEEISYIHYRRNLKLGWNESDSVMLITPLGIIGAETVPSVCDIKKYNGINENETLIYFEYAVRRICARLLSKDRIITIIGKTIILRKLAKMYKFHFKNKKGK